MKTEVLLAIVSAAALVIGNVIPSLFSFKSDKVSSSSAELNLLLQTLKERMTALEDRNEILTKRVEEAEEIIRETRNEVHAASPWKPYAKILQKLLTKHGLAYPPEPIDYYTNNSDD